MRFTFWVLIGLVAAALAACGQSPPASSAKIAEGILTSEAKTATPLARSSPTPAEAPTLLPDEPPPPGAGQFTTDFSKHSVPYAEILSGGPPKDGIPAIDQPRFVGVKEADAWLEPQEPVILFQVGDDARAYPIQILMWHEVVNDTVGDVPAVVTFCPLCNTAIAFERKLDGQMLDFGTTGRLHYSNLIMYDRQTESWWQQATGDAIAGEYTGRQLKFLPASIFAWADFKATYPQGKVLSRETGYARRYGDNPYAGYDDVNRPPFLYAGPQTPGVLTPMARVFTIDLNGEAVAYPYDVLQEARVVNDSVGGTLLVVVWAPGTASALDAPAVALGRDVGAANAFSRQLDEQTLSFRLDGERIVDEETGSQWDILGRAMSGRLAGRRLMPVVGVNHFWFSWAAFKPETRVYQPG